jgi:putative ABC transport system ATP-binding protein
MMERDTMTSPDRPHAAQPATAEPIIRLEGVTLNLRSAAGEVNVLRGIDLSVAAGEAVGVVGPSGAGKSTLMMIAAGLEAPSTGLVRVAGRDLVGLDEDSLARFRRDHVGIVFQAFRLVPTMTALENVAIPLELAGRADAFEAAEAALARVGLAARTDHYPDQLSGGEQQPRAADEPTGNLDGRTGDTIIELLFSLARDHGTTLLLITHDTTLAGRCDRVIHIADGRIVDGDAALAAE